MNSTSNNRPKTQASSAYIKADSPLTGWMTKPEKGKRAGRSQDTQIESPGFKIPLCLQRSPSYSEKVRWLEDIKSHLFSKQHTNAYKIYNTHFWNNTEDSSACKSKNFKGILISNFKNMPIIQTAYHCHEMEKYIRMQSYLWYYKDIQQNLKAFGLKLLNL